MRKHYKKLRAADLALLLSTVLDSRGAAAYLGIERGSVEYAAYRKRIPFVQFGHKKLFTEADLRDYRKRADRGRRSRLETVEPEAINPSRSNTHRPL